MTISDLLIIAASTWWTSYVLTSSDGPFQVFSRVRNWRGGRWHGRKLIFIEREGQQVESKYYGLLDCPLCLSIWVAIVFVLAPVGWLTYAFAAAGISMLLHSYTGWRSNY